MTNTLSTRVLSRQLKIELELEFAYKEVGRALIVLGVNSKRYQRLVLKAQGIRKELHELLLAQEQIKKLGGY